MVVLQHNKILGLYDWQEISIVNVKGETNKTLTERLGKLATEIKPNTY